MPVGKATLGRILDEICEAMDLVFWPIHRRACTLAALPNLTTVGSHDDKFGDLVDERRDGGGTRLNL